MARVLEALRQEVPEFNWQVASLHAKDYGLAQTRRRVFTGHEGVFLRAGFASSLATLWAAEHPRVSCS